MLDPVGCAGWFGRANCGQFEGLSAGADLCS